MFDKNNRGSDTLTLLQFPPLNKRSRKVPAHMLLPLQPYPIFRSGSRMIFIHGPPVHSGAFLLPVFKGENMHCPSCGSPDIQLRHVGKKTGGVIGATAGGLAGLEGASAGALMGSAVPVIGTLAGGLIGFLSGACAGAVAGAVAGEKLDGTIFDEYGCTRCEHTFNEP
ncbi:hypothetical protein MF265_21760 [Serratia marcescens]|uniref:hypothetical protein n=1 Tax=Serratia marcescens TaxID=615 RepID=UPI001EF04980|nr:hypothetical protein [Serratia marcescens]ULH10518.1 hypothetical protein MF265_21760 [Serratia marcescens]